MTTEDKGLLVELTADIVSAYVANNPVPMSELPSVIDQVHRTVSGLGDARKPDEQDQRPAVSVKRSVYHDHLICLEDGRTFKSLKRHLQTAHGLTPEQYRYKWGLPSDYPVVAPAYAKARSELARSLGLGKRSEATSAHERHPAMPKSADKAPAKAPRRGKAA